MADAPQVGYQERASDFEADELLSIREVIAILQRHYRMIAVCMVAAVICGFIYIFMTPPRFTATTSILIDPNQQRGLPEMLSDSFYFQEKLVIDSQIEVIRSSKLLEKAAQQAGVFDTVQAQETGWWSRFKEMIVGAPGIKMQKMQQERTKQAILNGFRGGLSVGRVDKTYVIKIRYTSRSPEIAAERANLIANTYLEDALEAQYEASQRTNQWLKKRLTKLRTDLSLAEQEVEAYKEKTNIVQTDGEQRITDQALGQINNKLIAARTEAAQAKAQYDRIKTIIEKGDPNSATNELLNNSVIMDLRGDYLELARHATEIKRKQGEKHRAYTNLQRQMDDIQQLMLDEYQRIAEGYRNSFEIANAKEKRLQEELDLAKSSSFVKQRDEIELRELKRRAESTRNLYTKMLDKYNEQTERQSIPVVHARIISEAGIPLSPSWPNKKLILLAALMCGAGVGIGLAFLREQFEKYIWKAEELETATQRICLGMLPKLDFDKAKLGKGIPHNPETAKRWITRNEPVEQPTPIQAPMHVFNREGFLEITSTLDRQTGITTEIMRNVQLAVRLDMDKKTQDKAKVLSFVSARPGEGKSITSCLLARHLAKTGAKVALVDCDFRRPNLTYWFLSGAETGFYELASRLGREPTEAVLKDISSICHKATTTEDLFFIPAKGIQQSITDLNLVASGQMDKMIAHLQKIFDIVLIDLPPIINIVDARVIAQSVDSFIFLSYWGKTDRDVVRKALNRAPEVYAKTQGCLLTLVDTNRASNYGYYNYHYYYHR